VVPATTAGEATVPVAVRRSGQVGLSWSAPASTGGLPISDYVLQSSRDGGRTWTTIPRKASPATTATVTGLVNGTPYVFRVAAVNGIGVGAFTGSTEVVVPATLAGPPTALKATRGNGEVQLTWKAPASAGGAAIGTYLLQTSENGGKTWSTVVRERSTSTTATIAGLVNGRPYTFRVAAVNDVGSGPFTQTSPAVVPATMPGVPTKLAVVRAKDRVTLSWVAPLETGGSPIVDYDFQWSSDGGATWRRVGHKPSTKTTATIRGLPGGIALAFRVAAVNAVGAGSLVETTIAVG
jgi:predicted phage tail protein